MAIKEKQSRLSELTESIAIQEEILADGSRRLKRLNDEYEKVNREYLELLSRKNKLTEELATLASNIDIYSNF